MQNSLQELWSLFSFVEPRLLGELAFFEKKFCEAILKGGYSHASKVEVETSRQCVVELRKLILNHVLRRTKKQLKLQCNLPERNEYIVFCPLTDLQYDLYEMYVEKVLEQSRKNNEMNFSYGSLANGNFSSTNQGNLLEVIAILRKIVNHPNLFFAYALKMRGQGFRYTPKNC